MPAKKKKKRKVAKTATAKRYPALNSLSSPRMKKFVVEVASGKEGTEALEPAGYNPGNITSKRTMASNLLKRDDIQMALSEVILKSYPGTQQKISKIMDSMLDMARQAVNCPHCGNEVTVTMPSLRPGEMINVIKTYAEICGWKAPSKSMSLTAKVDSTKYKLPED